MVVRVMNRLGRAGGAGAPRRAGARPDGARPVRARGTLATVGVAVLVAATLIATGTPSGAAGPERGAGPMAGAGPTGGAAGFDGGGDDPGPVVRPAPATAGGAVAEADVSYHGHVSFWNGHVGIWLSTTNHGPSPVPGATVRLRFSVPLAAGAVLPPNCLRTGPAVVHCGTGSMRAAGTGAQLALDVATVGTRAEMGLDIDTVWNGGASDRNPANNTHRVLTLATGDPYTF
ncbi:hypothetical protein ACIBCO_35395 [Streptomyces violascens]|uniref:hypothetical protein n=1 Tax=Streptomyces violascens TaxID=67381 RepID=UPI00379DF46C